MRLNHKVALLTGAGGGIGSAICHRFIAEGALLAATDLNEGAAAEAVQAAPTGRALVLSCDAGDSRSVQAAVEKTVDTFGHLDILCSVAGGSSANDSRVTEALEEEFWRVIRVDLFGTFLLCKYGIPELIRSGGGSVINMTSMTALIGTTGRDCYTAAKGGVVSMTRSIATEYARHGVRVNAIAPGMTRTPRVLSRPASSGRLALEAKHLLGPAEPMDIAEMAVYLASDESRVVTGQVLRVDSGATIH